VAYVQIFLKKIVLQDALVFCQSGPKFSSHNLSSTDLGRGSCIHGTHSKRWLSWRFAAFLILPLILQFPVASFAAPVLSKISCGGTSFTGPLSKPCSVYLSEAAQSATSVTLKSNNAAVSVPTTVTVNAGKSTGGFTAYINAVQTAQTATLTGTSGSVSTTLNITATPATTATLGVSAQNLAFGNTVVNTSTSQSLTLTSTGSGPLTISAATVSGSGFSVSGVNLPITLNPGQSTALTVGFNPAIAGTAAGTLTISSNSSGGPSTAISLTGVGLSAVSTLSCASSSVVGPATTSCTVALNASAPTGGQAVTLLSNNAAASLPASIAIPAGASSAAFNATLSSVTSNQAATLTASANGISKSFVLQVQPGTPTLGVSSTSVAFGNVTVNKTVTAVVTLSSTGNSPVKASSASVTGAGFSLSGATFPVTLNPGQSLALTVQFAPTAAGAATGSLTISSNSSTGNTVTVSLSGTGMTAPAQSAPGTTYYLATASAGGKDSNNGLSVGSPWLSPNHSLNCGDVIIALASSAYDSANFNDGHWGTVSCPSGNNVAWLQCESFDGCKISTNAEGIYVDRSYWGVQGFEVSVSGTNGFCFGAAPNYSHPANTHHVIFANNIANGCMGGGFVTFNVGTSGSDYLTIVGNIVYNAAQGSDQCYSGISLYEPVQSDSAPGTHLYVAGNFSWGNYQPNPCGGVQPWGGDGIIFDTLDGSQHPMPSQYVAQAVAANNILIGNGGFGIEIQNNVSGSVHAPIFVSHNTVWGNEGNSAMQPNAVFCSEVFLNSTYNVQETSNLVATKAQKACVNNPAYALAGYDIDGTVSVANNFAFGYNNQNTSFGTAPNFTFNSNNIVGQDPKFSNAYVPGAPACGGASNVPDCMASVINNFTPTNTAAISTGYQRADSTPVVDPLFPQWVCSANLPTGLTPMGCKAQ
jgi:Abnormal spindle-like microcephaly-assoc'd, ASPM-SPD-2-Hydin